MPFQISAELRYTIFEQSTLPFNLHALETSNQTITDESFTVTQSATCEFSPLETGENRYVRLDTSGVSDLLINYDVTVATNPSVREVHAISHITLAMIEHEVLPYLFASRYCQSDRLGRLASKHFGHITHPLAQASAVSGWIFENIDYVSGSTDTGTSAEDTVTQRAGVCRDFAHLGIAFCRALCIPARYFTGYACEMQPPDFHACFEVCVGNEWFVFDPTRLSAPNVLVRIATGRDAADSSVVSIFGAVQLEWMSVSCTADSFLPMTPEEMTGKAILLEP